MNSTPIQFKTNTTNWPTIIFAGLFAYFLKEWLPRICHSLFNVSLLFDAHHLPYQYALTPNEWLSYGILPGFIIAFFLGYITYKKIQTNKLRGVFFSALIFALAVAIDFLIAQKIYGEPIFSTEYGLAKNILLLGLGVGELISTYGLPIIIGTFAGALVQRNIITPMKLKSSGEIKYGSLKKAAAYALLTTLPAVSASSIFLAKGLYPPALFLTPLNIPFSILPNEFYKMLSITFMDYAIIFLFIIIGLDGYKKNTSFTKKFLYALLVAFSIIIQLLISSAAFLIAGVAG